MPILRRTPSNEGDDDTVAERLNTQKKARRITSSGTHELRWTIQGRSDVSRGDSTDYFSEMVGRR